MKYAALLALLFANAAWANGLDDLRTALGTLQGQGAVRGTFEARLSKQEADKAKAPESANATAYVEQDAGGLTVRWDRATLKRANDEANPPNKGKPKEMLSTLVGSSSALRIDECVNRAPGLLRDLEGAQLKAERNETYQGRPARVLELALVERAPDDEHINMKESVHTATVWVGPDNVPLAATVTHRRKAKVLVFLSFEQQEKEEFVFSQSANRLVVLKHDAQGTAKGLGSDGQYRNTYSFIPKA
jgi:hypothetical protein